MDLILVGFIKESAMPVTISTNLDDEIDARPLSPGCTPNPTSENPIFYKGWRIRQWTGWKGNRGLLTYPNKKRLTCQVCNKQVRKNQFVYLAQNTDATKHFKCSGNKGNVVGQWLACLGEWPNPEDSNEVRAEKVSKLVFAYSSVPGVHGLYQRGGCFSIEPIRDQTHLFYDTPQEKLEAAREDGLKRLKSFIDEYERILAMQPPGTRLSRDEIKVIDGVVTHILT